MYIFPLDATLEFCKQRFILFYCYNLIYFKLYYNIYFYYLLFLFIWWLKCIYLANSKVPDLEDLQKKKIIGSDATHFHFPLILELPVTDGPNNFLSDDIIRSQIEKLKSAYPANRKVIKFSI